MRRSRQRGLSYFAVGMIAVIATVILTYLGFTKSIPFRHHFQIKAVFHTSNNLRKASFVRIAGVNVGKVTKVEHLRKGEQDAVVTMRIDDKGLPIHKDATVSIRARIFLEGNFFVDLHPGTPSAPKLGDRDTIPVSQTSSPVQIDQILTSLQYDTRESLKKLLKEYSTGLSDGGSIGFNKSMQYWEAAYKNAAIVQEATLGQQPHDLSGVVKYLGVVAAALDQSPPQLKGFITDFNTTAAAFAREQDALEQTVAELPRTLRAARPALDALNNSFPPLRRLIVDLRPAVRSSGPALDASIPFIRQARALVSKPELRGLVADLRPTIPSLAALNQANVALFQQVRLAASCQNEVILPWSHDKIVDSKFPTTGNDGTSTQLQVYEEAPKALSGLSSESRSGDSNSQWYTVLAANGANTFQLGSLIGNSNLPLLGADPPKLPRPPLTLPNGASTATVPCETQKKPDLRTTVQTSGITQIRNASTPSSPAVKQATTDAVALLLGRIYQRQAQGALRRNATPAQRQQLAKLETQLNAIDRRVVAAATGQPVKSAPATPKAKAPAAARPTGTGTR